MQGSFLYAPHHEELKAILLINHLQQQERGIGSITTATMARPTAAELAAVDPNAGATQEGAPHAGQPGQPGHPGRGVLMRTYLAVFGQMVDNQVLKSISHKELEPVEQCQKCQVSGGRCGRWWRWGVGLACADGGWVGGCSVLYGITCVHDCICVLHMHECVLLIRVLH